MKVICVSSVRTGGGEYVQELEKDSGIGIDGADWMYDANEYDAGGRG